MSSLECAICARSVNNDVVCHSCRRNLLAHLTEIPSLQSGAAEWLVPSRSGSGQVSTERSIGINVSALDVSMAKELLSVLYKRAGQIRESRNLSPLVKIMKSTENQVKELCSFHLTHMEFSFTQPFIQEFAYEIKQFHAKGMAANKMFTERPRRIPCPTEGCLKNIVISDNILDEITCFGCKTSRSIYMIINLAMSNPDRAFMLDLEACGQWLNLSNKELKSLIKFHDIPRRGQLFDLKALTKAKNQLVNVSRM